LQSENLVKEAGISMRIIDQISFGCERGPTSIPSRQIKSGTGYSSRAALRE
jgi:hypothetical protein